MTEVSLSQNFDELFTKAERDPPSYIQLANNSGSYSGPSTRIASQNNSRGSPARKPTHTGMCPGNPALLGLRKHSAASRSHSMRDQTAHMREKYMSEKHRRLSTKSPIHLPKQVAVRNNSLPGEEIEVTRQFLATNNKVINRGDSFKRKATKLHCHRKRDSPAAAAAAATAASAADVAATGSTNSLLSHSADSTTNTFTSKSNKQGAKSEASAINQKIYRVAFLGASQVGKTSIIDQFMSSEHTDVYEREQNEQLQGDKDIDIRSVSVDVNGEESRLDLIEPAVEDLTVGEVVDDHNPDCVVVVYAVDDRDSFSKAESILDWLTKNSFISCKPCILVGNKSDLARSRMLEMAEGCELALEYSVKFTETSPGCGHHIDELLVGIAMQLRLYEGGHPRSCHKSIKDTVKGIISMVTGKEEEKRKICRNLNV